MKRTLLMALLLCLPLAGFAKPLVADLSQYRIEIDSDFTGTHLLLFGSRNETGDIVVAVRGPRRQFIVRKKERIAGLWVNRRERHFDSIPSYYVFAASKPFASMPHTELFAPLHIGLMDAVKANASGIDEPFANALIGIEESRHLYMEQPQKISFMGESLFKLAIPFPDNIPRGNYTADVYLFNDGKLTSMQSIPLHVEKTGFDAFIYDLAHDHPAFYGLLAIALALGIGWGASAVLQKT